MKILVTGGAGYIGSTLVHALLERGHQVTCLDRLFFGDESLQPVLSDSNLQVIKDDVRWFHPRILSNIDAAIDLASLSNDPSGELDPSKTLDINYLGRVRVAKLGKEYGVKRYLIASSCSVYGFQDGVLNESSQVNPLTTYAKANVMAEHDILPLADSKFTPTALRLATAYGLSGRMRFDIAINGIALGLHKTGKIPVMRDGNQWRPFVHVKDIAKAFMTALEAEAEKVKGQVFNVGSNEQNYQILPLAELVGKSIGRPFEIEWYGSPDNRSYRVSFDKVKQSLDFKTDYTPREGAIEIFAALKNGRVTDSLKTETVEWYKHILESQALSNEVSLRGTIL